MQVTPVTSEQSSEGATAGQSVQTASNSNEFNELMAFFSEKKGLMETAPPEPKSYTVQRGDNLWQISRNQLTAAGNKNPSSAEVNALVKQIAQASGIKNADILSVGQKLNLTPLTKASPQATTPQVVPELRPVEQPAPPLVPAAAASSQAALMKSVDAAKAKAATKTAAVIPDIKAAIASRMDPAFLRRREELIQSRSSAVATDGAASTRAADTNAASQAAAASSSKAAADAPSGGVDVKSLMRKRISPEFLRGNSTLGQGGPAVPAIKSTSAAGESADITMMIQSILEPGSVTLPDESKVDSPWSALLAGPGHLSSGYGMRKDPFTGDPQFHFGVDIAADTGTKIYPYEPGTVKFSGWLPGTGQAVVVQHADGLETIYGHASETLVKRGQVVTKETAIAEVGSTGRSTGPHLHFEARKNGRPIDPMPLLTNTESLHVAKTL